MSTDLRSLCAELVRIADALDGGTPLISNQGQALDGYSALAAFRSVADRARAALAEQEADGPAAIAEQPSDEEILELMPQQMREDLAAAARAIAEQAGTDSRRAMGAMRIILNRHAVDLALAVLARWGQPPAPPAEGEVEP